METKKIKIITIIENLPDKNGSKNGKDWTIHKAKVLAIVNGTKKEVVVSSFKALELPDGAEIEVEAREFNGSVEYEIPRQQGQRQGGGWGGGGGGRGYGKPAYTAREFFALEAFVFKRASERMDPLVSGDVFKALYSTMLIQAAEHGVKIEAATASGNGSAPSSKSAPAPTASRPTIATKPKPSDFADDIPF